MSWAYADDIKTLRCFFDELGVSAVWDNNGKFTSEVSKFSNKLRDGELIFDNIDKKARTARIIGIYGASDLIIIGDSNDLYFLYYDQTLITVFLSFPLKDGSFPAVMSSHQRIITPIISQNYGTCVNQTIN